MKKQLLTITMAVMALGTFAQSLPTMSKVFPVSAKKALPSIKNTERGGGPTCDNDTLHYPYLKEAIQTAPDFGGFGLLTGAATTGNAFSQKFTNAATVSISGVNFWGFVLDRTNPTQSLTIDVAIYNVNGTNRPTTSLGTTTITLNGLTDEFYTATFSSPIVTSSDYAVVLSNSSTTDTLGLVLNNATTATYGEGLASLQYNGTWYAIPTLFGAPNDFEAAMAPIVSYSFNTDFTVSANPTCIGTTLNFTNTTNPTAHLTNKMYNWNVFATTYSLAASDSTYAWDMDDASPLMWSNNASHAYAAAGSYDASLYTITGLWKTCVGSKTTTVVVDPNTVAGFTSDATNTPTIAFSNTSTGATSYSWDFGDGSPADNTANPSHTYGASGNYTVTLTATGPCGTNTSTTTVNIAATGINTYEMDALSVYPNPSNGLFTVKMNATAKTVVEIYNVIGEVVYSTQLTNNTAVVDLSNNAAGVYTMKVISGNSTSVKQIVLTK
ncbi:MAG: PKD domain-containing protein [Bacteroidetes bacterium]|nr:PKD domain-containing protein [Bacteroidota bacterium]